MGKTSWIRRVNILEMAVLPKAIFRFNSVLIKISILFFTKAGKNTFKIHMKIQNLPDSQTNPKQKKY